MLTNARRRWPAVEFRVINVAVQGPTAVPADHRRAQRARRRRDGRRDHPRPRRRGRRGPAAVLRRGAVPGGVRLPHAGDLARSATRPTRRWSTTSPTCARRRRPTPPSGSCPTSAEELQRHRARPAAARPRGAPAARPRAAPPRRRAHPAGARPAATPCSTSARPTSPALRDRAARCFAHRLDRGRRRPAAHAGPAAGAVPGGHARARLRDRAAGRRSRGAGGRPTWPRATASDTAGAAASCRRRWTDTTDDR